MPPCVDTAPPPDPVPPPRRRLCLRARAAGAVRGTTGPGPARAGDPGGTARRVLPPPSAPAHPQPMRTLAPAHPRPCAPSARPRQASANRSDWDCHRKSSRMPGFTVEILANSVSLLRGLARLATAPLRAHLTRARLHLLPGHPPGATSYSRSPSPRAWQPPAASSPQRLSGRPKCWRWPRTRSTGAPRPAPTRAHTRERGCAVAVPPCTGRAAGMSSAAVSGDGGAGRRCWPCRSASPRARSARS